MAYGARALRLRSPNSSRGCNTPPGRTRESSTGRSGTGDSIHRNLEVREMRTADTVLSLIQDRGRRGLPVEDLYRQLYNPTLYLRAYAKLYPNKGALTPGATPETVDGMSQRKIDTLID